MNIKWKQVSKEQFFSTVGKLDVHPTIINSKYPYTSDWKLRDGKVVGRSVGQENVGWLADNYLYFVLDNA
jgi:hypothetical protein